MKSIATLGCTALLGSFLLASTAVHADDLDYKTVTVNIHNYGNRGDLRVEPLNHWALHKNGNLQIGDDSGLLKDMVTIPQAGSLSNTFQYAVELQSKGTFNIRRSNGFGVGCSIVIKNNHGNYTVDEKHAPVLGSKKMCEALQVDASAPDTINITYIPDVRAKK